MEHIKTVMNIILKAYISTCSDTHLYTKENYNSSSKPYHIQKTHLDIVDDLL